MITVTPQLQVWRSDEGSSCFMRLPDEVSDEIRLHAMETRRGFGSVKVECNIGEVGWRTSVFPVKGGGGYFLPVKADVCRKAGLAEGNPVTVSLTPL